MKKSINLLIMAAVLMAVPVFAAPSVVSEGTFFATGANSATAVIVKRGGYISDENMYLKVATNVTVTIHRGKVSAPASAASTGTTITLPTTATNTIGGVVITTSDFLIVGGTLLDITGLNPTNASVVIVTNTASATVGLSDPVYVADNGDIVQFSATDTNNTAELNYVFTGFLDAPVAVQVPTGSGITFVSGRYQTKK